MTLSKDDADGLPSAVDGGDPAGEQAAMLFSISESFARLFSASLTTLLRGLVEMELKSVERATYGDFIMSLSPPTCLVIFRVDPLTGGAAMDVSANVLLRLIDRLLGGSGLLPVRLREFTGVEQVLIERVAIRAMADLQQAWQPAGTFGFRVEHLETNPQFVQLTAPHEVVALTTFDIKIGEEAGRLHLALPQLLLKPMMFTQGPHDPTGRFRAVVPQPARAMAPCSTPSRRPRPPARGRSSS
jgi:flagellar motor switch protein FliM